MYTGVEVRLFEFERQVKQQRNRPTIGGRKALVFVVDREDG
jgi:hypothetical protein